MGKKKIGIVGATGYTGSELVRILVNHPEVEISVITSESRAGERFSDVHPSFQGIEDQVTVDRFQVFNRFGQMVYDNDTPLTGWDGMQDGKQAPSDTYVFVIELTYQGCLKQSVKGNFMLIR